MIGIDGNINFLNDYVQIDKAAAQIGIPTNTLLKILNRNRMEILTIGEFLYIKKNDVSSVGDRENRSQATRNALKREAEKKRRLEQKIYCLVGKELEQKDSKLFKELKANVLELYFTIKINKENPDDFDDDEIIVDTAKRGRPKKTRTSTSAAAPAPESGSAGSTRVGE